MSEWKDKGVVSVLILFNTITIPHNSYVSLSFIHDFTIIFHNKFKTWRRSDALVPSKGHKTQLLFSQGMVIVVITPELAVSNYSFDHASFDIYNHRIDKRIFLNKGEWNN